MSFRFRSLPLALSVALGVLSASGVFGCSASSPTRELHRPGDGPSAEVRKVYRFDYVVRLGRGDVAPTVGKYSFGLEEGRNGEVRLGANMPLSRREGPSVARQDVGFVLRSSFQTSKDALLLHCNVEMSSADELPSVRKVSTSGDVSIAPGKPVVVARVDDPDGHFTYEVEVTATKLN